MSELATEIAASPEPVSTVELLGRTFAERRAAFTRVNAFAEVTRRALADSVEVLVGQEVEMVFRPSMTTMAEAKMWFPYYSLDDEIREPVRQAVTIVDIDERGKTVYVACGERADGRYEREWSVLLGNVLTIEALDITSEEG